MCFFFFLIGALSKSKWSLVVLLNMFWDSFAEENLCLNCFGPSDKTFFRDYFFLGGR